MTQQELMDAMGSMTSEREADAMADILDELGIESLDEISDAKFFALIPEAIQRAKGQER